MSKGSRGESVGQQPSIREQVLNTARDAVMRDRQETYGTPEDSFGMIAGLWSVYLGTKVTRADVAALMTLLKMARAKKSPKHLDNWADAAGYAACGADVAMREANNGTTG